MHYDPAATNDELFARLQAFAQTHLPRFGTPFARAVDRTPRRRLRVGWLSPRFAEGPVASFFPGLLAAFDRTRHRHLLIALQPARDAAIARFEALADEWIVLAGLDDATLLQRLRALELDVLVDLAGHSTANRIGVVAQRVAPVQASWLDWFDTTAVTAMDAWISDAWLTPEDSTQRDTERVLRLPSGRFCYMPPPDAPPPTYAGGGTIVFASFNRLAKLNADVVSAWASILRRVPGSRLELGTRLLGDEATREYTRERFAAHGIAADRLVLHGQRTYPELLVAYQAVDIALDPFPFSGCTTTCDALYMGAAVIARTGETFVSRQSASLLERLGHDEWIARDADDYIERAVAASARVAALRASRETQRRDVITRLCDAAAQARDFAAALGELVGPFAESAATAEKKPR
jgi:predicted O-linked N-acetylglucosamine transferase (SPINDLY family)